MCLLASSGPVWLPLLAVLFFFFFNDTATTEIYTLSLHDALPISRPLTPPRPWPRFAMPPACKRSEEHTSELQSLRHLVCRLLLEKKKKMTPNPVLLAMPLLPSLHHRRPIRL